MTRLETLQARLAAAEARYDDIMLNPQVTQVSFSLGGQNSTSKQPTDPKVLQAYIQELKIQISRLEGCGGRAVMVGLEW